MRIEGAGFLLALSGFMLFLACAMPVTRVGKPVDFSFSVEPGGSRAPYEDGTYHHTSVFCDSALVGTVSVQNASIRLDISGFNAGGEMEPFEHLVAEVRGQGTFVVEPAEDQYTFTFENPGPGRANVEFSLVEIRTAAASPGLWLVGLLGQIVLLPASLGLLLPRKGLVRCILPAAAFICLVLFHQIVLINGDHYTLWWVGGMLLTTPIFSICAALSGAAVMRRYRSL